MRFSPRAGLAAGLVLVGVAGGLVYGFALRPAPAAPQVKADDAKPGPDEAEVHKALEAFVAAFNDNDAAKMAATLTATAEYIDDDSNRIEGSKAIGELLGKFFAANKGAKLQITPEGTRTVAPGVAIEDGESVITIPDKQTQSVRKFTIVYTKADGAWKIASIRSTRRTELVSAAERLKDLDFLIGEWVDEGGDSREHHHQVGAGQVAPHARVQRSPAGEGTAHRHAADRGRPADRDRKGLVVRLVRRLRRIDVDEERRPVAHSRNRRYIGRRRGRRDLHPQASVEGPARTEDDAQGGR